MYILGYVWWKLGEIPRYCWRGPDWAPVLRYSLERGWIMEK